MKRAMIVCRSQTEALKCVRLLEGGIIPAHGACASGLMTWPPRRGVCWKNGLRLRAFMNLTICRKGGMGRDLF